MNENHLKDPVVAAALRCVCGLVIVLTIGIAGYFAVQLLNFLSPAVMPLLIGMFLAMLCRPVYDSLWKIESWFFCRVFRPRLKGLAPDPVKIRKMGLDVYFTAGLFFTICIGVVVAVSYWFASFLVTSLSDFLENIPTTLAQFVLRINLTYPEVATIISMFDISQPDSVDGVVGFVQRYGREGVGILMSAGRCLSSIQTLVLVLTFFTLFIMVRPSPQKNDIPLGVDALIDGTPFLSADTKAFLKDQINEFVKILVRYFRKQVCIDLVEGLVFGLVLQFVPGVKIPYGFVLGFMFGFLNLIPVIGTIICLPLILPVAYFAGNLVVVGVSILILQLVDQVVTTKFQGDDVNLGAIEVVFSFVFWGLVFHSFVGVLLAIPMSAFCRSFWNVFRRKYLSTSTEENDKVLGRK